MKKAIELSLNFLVTIIIALVIFGFGIKFIYDIAGGASELKDITIEDLDKRIEDLVCESTDRVCIPTTTKVIKRGKFDVFGIKIINVISDAGFDDKFGINIVVSKMIKRDKTETTDPDILNKVQLKHRGDVEAVYIKKNEEKDIGIGVEVKKEAPSGTYILDVEIPPYDELHKIYVEVP